MTGVSNLLNISTEPEFTKGLIASRVSALIKSKKKEKKPFWERRDVPKGAGKGMEESGKKTGE